MLSTQFQSNPSRLCTGDWQDYVYEKVKQMQKVLKLKERHEVEGQYMSSRFSIKTTVLNRGVRLDT